MQWCTTSQLDAATISLAIVIRCASLYCLPRRSLSLHWKLCRWHGDVQEHEAVANLMVRELEDSDFEDEHAEPSCCCCGDPTFDADEYGAPRTSEENCALCGACFLCDHCRVRLIPPSGFLSAPVWHCFLCLEEPQAHKCLDRHESQLHPNGNLEEYRWCPGQLQRLKCVRPVFKECPIVRHMTTEGFSIVVSSRGVTSPSSRKSGQ